MFQAIGALERVKILVAYVDLLRAPTKKQLADHLAGAIYGGIVAPVEKVMLRAIGAFQNLPIRPKINVEPDGTPSFEFGVGEDTRDLDKSIEELLELVGKVAKSRRRMVVLVMDEFQEIVAIDPRLPALLRSVFQFQSEVSHVFLGSKHHLMRRVFTLQNEPMYKMAKMLELHEIPHDDFAGFIRDRFAATNRLIADEAVDHLLGITEGHPHDTQELCYFTWSLPRGEISVEVVNMQPEFSGNERRLDELSERFARLEPLAQRNKVEFDVDPYLRDFVERNPETPSRSHEEELRAAIQGLRSGHFNVFAARGRLWHR